MGLVRTLPGINLSNDLILNANDSMLAGVSAANVVVQRDGVDASAAGRWPAGFQAATIVKGVHSFKTGFEARFASSEFRDDVDSNSWSTFPRVFGGETQYTLIQGINSANMPGLQGTAITGNVLAMRGLLTLLSGALAEVHQLYWLGSAQRLDRFDETSGEMFSSCLAPGPLTPVLESVSGSPNPKRSPCGWMLRTPSTIRSRPTRSSTSTAPTRLARF